ncbi:hypothetical protein CICLE_v100013571mg, partial [Citrus x clementina]
MVGTYEETCAKGLNI